MDCEKRLKKLIAIALSALSIFLTPMTAQAADLFTNLNEAEGIYIVPGSDINLVARSSNIPVQIKNTFDADVTVHVYVRPTNLRVVVPSAVAIKVPAQTSVTAKVPVEAIANGDVYLKVWIETFSGVRIGTPVVLSMNVNADVESTLLISFGGGVLLLLGFGITRTIRKNRSHTGYVNKYAEGESA